MKTVKGRRCERLPSGELPLLRPRAFSTGAYEIWSSVAPRGQESVRWECVDGRWVSVTLGTGAFVGTAEVRDSAGVFERVDSYEEALSLASKWRAI
jgi:hypothetical protein